MNQCHICNKDIHFGGTKYCSEPCRDIAKKATQRVANQNKVLKRAMEGQECKRCNLRVYETNMKKYCNSCTEILKVSHYSGYVPKKRVKTVYTCKTCNNPRTRTRTYCDTCKEERRLNSIKKQTEERKEAKKSRQCNKKTPPVNPMFLVRGKISNNIVTSMTGA